MEHSPGNHWASQDLSYAYDNLFFVTVFMIAHQVQGPVTC
jgi:hypothetical protein